MTKAFRGPWVRCSAGWDVHRLGGFMVESNQGHIGDDIDPKRW